MALRSGDLPGGPPGPRAPAAPDSRSSFCAWLQPSCFLASPTWPLCGRHPDPPLELTSSQALLVPTLSTLLLCSSQVHGQPLCPVWSGEWQSGVGLRVWTLDLGWSPISHRRHLRAVRTGCRAEGMTYHRPGDATVTRSHSSDPVPPHRRLNPSPGGAGAQCRRPSLRVHGSEPVHPTVRGLLRPQGAPARGHHTSQCQLQVSVSGRVQGPSLQAEDRRGAWLGTCGPTSLSPSGVQRDFGRGWGDKGPGTWSH